MFAVGDDVFAVVTQPLDELANEDSLVTDTVGDAVSRCLECLPSAWQSRAIRTFGGTLVAARPLTNLAATASLLRLAFRDHPVDPSVDAVRVDADGVPCSSNSNHSRACYSWCASVHPTLGPDGTTWARTFGRCVDSRITEVFAEMDPLDTTGRSSHVRYVEAAHQHQPVTPGVALDVGCQYSRSNCSAATPAASTSTSCPRLAWPAEHRDADPRVVARP